MECKCGFEFSGPGEFRNCEAFVTKEGKSGVVCPECGDCWGDGVYMGTRDDVFKAPAEGEERNENGSDI